MRENKYDEKTFFQKYSRMDRSTKGLAGAGEWHVFRRLLPAFSGKRVLDLGCGFGWHCAYAAKNGAACVTGVDLSEQMLERARRENAAVNINYLHTAIEDISFPDGSFDIVISSLALHYVASFQDICVKVYRYLTAGGDFVFSVEHPVFTAQGPQDWCYDASGVIRHWPVDHYFSEGRRNARFLGEPVVKYHRTLTSYLTSLLGAGFRITGVTEPQPDPSMLGIPGMQDELRRPMMLIVSAKKE